jgi:hypothetical protein
MANLVTNVKIASDEDFSEQVDLGGLETFMNDSFGTRGMQLVPGYLSPGSPTYPSDMSFLVLTQTGNQKDSPFAGVLLAESKTVDGFSFDYYDKVAVAPEYRNNGAMKEMVGTARALSGEDFKIPPGVLRTSDPELNETYGKMSDTSVKIGDFYIHGFGFLDDEKNSLFNGAEKKFELAAEYVAALPQTLVEKP